MGFYDNYNFDGLKILSKIKSSPSISEPCPEFVGIVRNLKHTPPDGHQKSICVAEIGIGVGATALQIVQLLGENDIYVCFDFEEKVQNLTADLNSERFNVKCQIVPFGNSHDIWDSYNYNLSELIFQMREDNLDGFFDVVYLDGAHTLLHDGLAVCLLKQLVKKGGFLILDDVFFTYSLSERDKKFAKGKLPNYQRDDKQILRIQELFLRHDPYFEKLSDDNAWRGIFRKRKLVTP